MGDWLPLRGGGATLARYNRRYGIVSIVRRRVDARFHLALYDDQAAEWAELATGGVLLALYQSADRLLLILWRGERWPFELATYDLLDTGGPPCYNRQQQLHIAAP